MKINIGNIESGNSTDFIITKRKILHVTHKIFDVIGVTCPKTIHPKILLQKTWELKLKWDEEITTEIKNAFLRWFEELPCLMDIEIPRWISGDVNRTLHVFCDASQSAYAAQ